MTNDANMNHILIIDDEPALLELLTLCLSRRGYYVDTAGSGEEGIKKIKINNYSLIITDLVMPGMSGNLIYSFLRDVLKKSTPVVGMSGNPVLFDQGNFDAVLSKPYSIKEILKVIDQLI